MLDHLKQRAARILATAKTATLSTSGPAGIQARAFPCEADDVYLFLLVPGTSDHLLNLEQDSHAVASTPEWQLSGAVQVLRLAEAPPDLMLPQLPTAPGCMLVMIRPSQLHLFRRDGWGFRETIDFDPDS